MGLAAALRGMPETPAPAKQKLAPLPLQGSAKSTHPDFRQVKVYLRADTWRRASRKFEDEGGGDGSDLVEKLLREYLGT